MKKIMILMLVIAFLGSSFVYAKEKKFDATVVLEIKGQKFILTLDEIRELKKVLSNFDPAVSWGYSVTTPLTLDNSGGSILAN